MPAQPLPGPPSPTVDQPLNQATSLYEQDFYAWTQHQAAKLRTGELATLDREHLAEEIESVGISEQRELLNRLKELLLHLLKWHYQPSLRSTSWELSIANQRDDLADLCATSPSLRPKLDDVFAKAYQRARRNAAKETGLPLTTFPITCPFTPEQVLDDDFWPQ